jgi:hypothetical protein
MAKKGKSNWTKQTNRIKMEQLMGTPDMERHSFLAAKVAEDTQRPKTKETKSKNRNGGRLVAGTAADATHTARREEIRLQLGDFHARETAKGTSGKRTQENRRLKSGLLLNCPIVDDVTAYCRQRT